MTKKAIIERTVHVLNQLPPEKASEISDFADFIIKKYEDSLLTRGIQEIIQKSDTFDFLNDEEELYSREDLKEKFYD